MLEQSGGHEQLITVPDFVRKGVGDVAVGTAVEDPAVIDHVPGVEVDGGYRDADAVVAAINATLADRDDNATRPVVAAGDMVRHP